MPAHGVQLENIPSAAPSHEFESFHMGEKFTGNAITSRSVCEYVVVIETTNISLKDQLKACLVIMLRENPNSKTDNRRFVALNHLIT